MRMCAFVFGHKCMLTLLNVSISAWHYTPLLLAFIYIFIQVSQLDVFLLAFGCDLWWSDVAWHDSQLSGLHLEDRCLHHHIETNSTNQGS